MTSQSIPYASQIVDLFFDLGVSDLNINYVQPLGRASGDWPEIGVDWQTRLTSYKEVLDHILARHRQGDYLRERFFTLALSKVIARQNVNFMDFKNPCGMAIGQLAYSVDGSIYTCDEGRDVPPFRLGSVYEDSYADILGSPKTQALVSQSIPAYPECSTCAYEPFCGLCPVLNYVEGVSLETCENDPRCHFVRFLYDYLFDKILHERELVTSIAIHNNLSLFTKSEPGRDGR